MPLSSTMSFAASAPEWFVEAKMAKEDKKQSVLGKRSREAFDSTETKAEQKPKAKKPKLTWSAKLRQKMTEAITADSNAAATKLLENLGPKNREWVQVARAVVVKMRHEMQQSKYEAEDLTAVAGDEGCSSCLDNELALDDAQAELDEAQTDLAGAKCKIDAALGHLRRIETSLGEEHDIECEHCEKEFSHFVEVDTTDIDARLKAAIDTLESNPVRVSITATSASAPAGAGSGSKAV